MILTYIETSCIAHSACTESYRIADMLEMLSYLLTKLDVIYDFITPVQAYSQRRYSFYNRT